MRGIRALFQPESVAVLGASAKDGSLGNRVMANLQGGSFKGPILPVHPSYRSVHRILCYASVADLPLAPELAVLCTPADVTADLVASLGQRGTRAAIVFTADPDGHGPDTAFKCALREAARAHGVRILGPSAAGIQVPAIGLNASTLTAMTAPGKLALVSQSGAIAGSVVEWASSHGIGFSHVIAAGDGLDLDMPELLDYLAADMRTRAVLLYVRAVGDGRRFLSASRSVARIKPLLVIRPNTGGLADEIHNAAFRRAGILRVGDTGEWFDAVESLGFGKFPVAERVTIIGNGDAPGQLAAAPLLAANRLASLGEATIEKLAQLVPKGIQPGNPLDLGRDADPARFAAAIQILLGDSAAGAILITHSPSFAAPAAATAQAVADAARKTARPVIACWMGGPAERRIHDIFTAATIPLFDTPERAARAFLHLVNYRLSQETMMQLPAARPKRGDDEADLLLHDEAETKAIMYAYGTMARHILEDQSEMDNADSLAVLRAYGFAIDAEAKADLPVRLSVSNDPTFGRVMILEAAGRRAVVLPPLNMALAERSVAAVLPALGPDMDGTALQAALVRLADLLVDLPEVTALEIPALSIANGDVVVSSARLSVAAPDKKAVHLAIRPYPHRLEQRLTLKDGRQALVRPLRPEDEPLYRGMLAKVAADDLFLRFCTRFGGETNSVPPELLSKLIQIDYDRDMSFIALAPDEDGQPSCLGVVDIMSSADQHEAEFSILLRSDLKGTGLGKALMEKIIGYATAKGIGELNGVILRNNQGMRGLCTRLGFTTTADPDDDMVNVTLPLKR